MKVSLKKNWLNKLIFISQLEVAFCCLSSELEEKAKLCQFDDTTSVSKNDVARVPNYFFRPFPISNKASYANDSINYVLDLNNKSEVGIPGPYDPVPTPDEKLMTIPPDNGLTFYDMNRLLKGDTKPLFQDTALKGVYQSIGTVANSGNETIYRIITDQKGLSFRDYKMIEHTDGSKTVQALRDEPKILCQNIRISLPMISKDGKQVAALDVNEGVTKIFNINTENGSCSVAYNLGIATGKVDFSFNNDDVAFHVLNNNSGGADYFKIPSDSLVANVFVLKRSTGEISRITNNTDSNSVYPAWRQDGKLMYLNHPKRHGGDRKPSQFVLADPAKTNPMSFELIQQGSCKGQPAEKAFNSISALGGLWAQVCSTYGDEISASSASLNTLSLDPDHCNSLVKKYWTDTKPKLFNNKNFMGNKKIVENILQDLTIEDLLAACPRNKFDATVPNGNTGGVGNTQKEPPIPGKCMECHDGEIPFDNWQELRTRVAKSGRPFVDEILDRIERTGSGKMPPRSQTITAAEKEAFVLYLKTGVIP